MADEHIVRYTAEKIDAMIARGESRTDWARVDAMTEEELEASIDYEEEGVAVEDEVYLGIPGIAAPKEAFIPLDMEVIAWFRDQGGDYPVQINAVLRSYIKAQKAAAKTPR